MKNRHFWYNLVLKPVGILTLLFALSIALIRAQPYDDQDLRGFLTPLHDCTSPCWQGIRPGETTVLQVMDLLKANQWIGNVHFENYSTFSNGYIRWSWSGSQPHMVSRNDATNLWFDDNITQNFYIETQAHFGDVWLLLGKPDWFNIYQMYNRVRVDGIYKDQVMMVTFEIPCSPPSRNFWLAKTDLVWIKDLPTENARTDNLVVSCR